MNGRSFFDTNLLVYTDDQDAPEEQKISLQLIESARVSRRGVISTQVLQEYFVSAVGKLKVPAAVARRKVEIFSRLEVVRIDPDDILGAIDLHRLHQLHFWDAIIIRAAIRSGCSTLYSEDLQSGRRIEGLEIVNPFA